MRLLRLRFLARAPGLRRLGVALLTALLAGLCGPVAAQPRFDFETTDTGLPKAVRPQRVQLSLDLDPAREDFNGRAVMSLRVTAPVSAIELHADDLVFVRGHVTQSGVKRVLQATVLAETQRWRLTPAGGGRIVPGTANVELHYRARVQSTGLGLFRVDHRARGADARMLATQLEAIGARKLMPAFDEPVFRSVFELDVRAPRGFEVLSNMPRRSRVADGAGLRHRFAPTPPMSSYLLAVAVGRFDVLEGRSQRTPLRIFTAPGKREQAQFAMQSTRQVLPYFANYFERPYALPKLDQLAVPGVRRGAMEDWGLISYIEDGLLFDPATQPPSAQRDVFAVVAHEISHQWFGNLVTAANWSEIWLNEAFATWMERKASAHFHPQWQVPLTVRQDMERVLDRDAGGATRAIRSGPVDEQKVFEVFDSVTYNKGGAVLSMIEQWVGERTFRRGLASYMRERGFSNATAGDLWHHIGRAAGGLPVAAVAASWTDQPGVPLVGVTAACEQGRTRVTLRQQRFSSGAPLAGGPWRIPVVLRQGAQQRTVLLDGHEARLDWPGCGDAPLLANAGAAGYYRVEYDAGLALRNARGFVSLPATDRVALLNDGQALAVAARRPAGEQFADQFAMLAQVPRVQDDSRAAMFTLASRQWIELGHTLHGLPAHEALRQAGLTLFAPELSRLGWEPRPVESDETLRLRAELIDRLAALGDVATVAAARERFAAAMAGDAARLHPSLREAVLFAVGAQPNDAEFDAMLARLRGTDAEAERWTLAGALARGRDAGRARRLLEASSDGSISDTVSMWLPGMVARHPELAHIAYDFLLVQWPTFSRLAGDATRGDLPWLLPDTAWNTIDLGLIARLQADQQRLVGERGASVVQRAAVAIETRVRVREREATALVAILDRWRPGAP